MAVYHLEQTTRIGNLERTLRIYSEPTVTTLTERDEQGRTQAISFGTVDLDLIIAALYQAREAMAV